MLRRTTEASRRQAAMRWIPLGLLLFFLIMSSFVMGLASGDDSGYLNSSSTFRLGDFFHYQDWSPLYVLWFKVLRVVCPNPIACFFLSWGLLAALLTMIPTWCRLRSAWIYALILVGLPFLTIDPFVSFLGAAILLFGTCLVLRREQPIAETAALFCLLAFGTSFARPEFDYGVYLSAAVTLTALAVDRLRLLRLQEAAVQRSTRRSIALGCVVLLLAAAIFAVARHPRAPRSGIAFAQHYNLRAAEHGIIPFPNFWNADYAQRRFGMDPRFNAGNTPATVFDFLRANPRHFLGHMRENLRDPRAIVLILVFAVFVLWPWLRHSSRRLRHASLFILLIGIPCVAASVMIYPRAHYAMVLLPSLILYVLELFDAGSLLPARPAAIFAAGCALIWLSLVGVPARRHVAATEDRVYLQRLHCVRDVDSTASFAPKVFEAVKIHDIYLVHPRVVDNIATLPQWADFKTWAAQQHPAWIAVDDTLAPSYRITPNELDDTLRNDLKFVPHPCPFDAHLTLYTPDTIAP